MKNLCDTCIHNIANKSENMDCEYNCIGVNDIAGGGEFVTGCEDYNPALIEQR